MGPGLNLQWYPLASIGGRLSVLWRNMHEVYLIEAVSRPTASIVEIAFADILFRLLIRLGIPSPAHTFTLNVLAQRTVVLTRYSISSKGHFSEFCHFAEILTNVQVVNLHQIDTLKSFNILSKCYFAEFCHVAMSSTRQFAYFCDFVKSATRQCNVPSTLPYVCVHGNIQTRHAHVSYLVPGLPYGRLSAKSRKFGIFWTSLAGAFSQLPAKAILAVFRLILADSDFGGMQLVIM